MVQETRAYAAHSLFRLEPLKSCGAPTAGLASAALD